jgi:hypothetical protein
VNLEVTDKHGEVYAVNLEFVAHDFDADDVQVSVYKLPKNHEELIAKHPGFTDILNQSENSSFRLSNGGICPIYPPNVLLHNEKIIDKRASEHTMIPNVWFEFHQVDDLPAVRS